MFTAGKNRTLLFIFGLLFFLLDAPAQEAVYPGADEKTPSKAQYFSWINNTNEGTTEQQTQINLDFFAWLKEEYGMQLDIYAFETGPLTGSGFTVACSRSVLKNNFLLVSIPFIKRPAVWVFVWACRVAPMVLETRRKKNRHVPNKWSASAAITTLPFLNSMPFAGHSVPKKRTLLST